MKVGKLIAGLGFLIGTQSALWAQNGPIGFSVSDTTNSLYRIDLLTGFATNLGVLNYPQDDELEGLASINGTLYGVGEANYGTGGLYNITTPPGTLVGSTGPRLGSEAGAAYSPATGLIYNLQADENLPPDTARSFLYSIDPATAASTFIGFSPFYADGLAINSLGEAFATDFRLTGSLYRVDLATGALSLVGSLGLPESDLGFDSGLAFDLSNDALYALREDGAIYTVNAATGAAAFQAFVTENGVRVPGDLEGLDIPIPEPSTLLLLGAGLAGAAVKVRRRRNACDSAHA